VGLTILAPSLGHSHLLWTNPADEDEEATEDEA
jgi:hypothetical protein